MSLQKKLSGISTPYTNNIYSDYQTNTYDISNNYIICNNTPTINTHLTNKCYVDLLSSSLQTQINDINFNTITISGSGYFSRVATNVFLNSGNFGINIFKNTNLYSLSVSGTIFCNGNIIGDNINANNFTDMNDLKTKTTNITYTTDPSITNVSTNKIYMGNELFLNTAISFIYLSSSKTNFILSNNTDMSIRSNGIISFKDAANQL